jgi:hypothetical protein
MKPFDTAPDQIVKGRACGWNKPILARGVLMTVVAPSSRP